MNALEGSTTIVVCHVCRGRVLTAPSETVVLITNFAAICEECWPKVQVLASVQALEESRA